MLATAPDVCYAEIVTTIILLRLTPQDFDIARSSNLLFQYETLADQLYLRASELETDDFGYLQLIDSYLPPRSLLQALSALSYPQIARIAKITTSRRAAELRKIWDGIISTIKEDDKKVAYNFLNLLSCIVNQAEQLRSISIPSLPLSVFKTKEMWKKEIKVKKQ